MKILLVLDTRNDIRNDIVEELTTLGHEVRCLPIRLNFKITYLDKILNFILYYLFNNDKYIKNRIIKNDYKINKQKEIILSNNLRYDLCLVFRADAISDDDLNLYQSLSERLVAYQWDGMSRYPNFKDKINYFNQVYCFDPSDELLPKIKFLPNFYFKNLLSVNSTKNIYDVTYIGYYYKDRLDLLQKISDLFPHLKLNLVLKSFDKEENKIINKTNFLNKSSKIYSYQEMILEHSKSKIIFDIKHEIHDGLSFRLFEAMALKKKIITTNPSVSNYDFYNPSNIMILTNDNLTDIESFIKIPYQDLPQDILFKYSFENWFNTIANIDI